MRSFWLLVVFGITFVTYGQKYGYIDSDYILENIPEYVEAKQELDKYADRWKKEIDELYLNLEKRRSEYMRVEAILPDEEREIRKKELEKMESEVLETQQLRFGVSGDLFSKRRELIEPIQDRVFEAIEKVANQRNFAFIFDKANQSNLIFADPKFNINKLVLKELKISEKEGGKSGDNSIKSKIESVEKDVKNEINNRKP